MIFDPQKYALPDAPGRMFLDAEEIRGILRAVRPPSLDELRTIVGRSMDNRRLSLQETAALIAADDP